MATATLGTRQKTLNTMTPAAQKAKLGDVIADLTAQLNALTTAHQALLAHLDAGAVAGLGTAHVANYSANTQVTSLEKR